VTDLRGVLPGVVACLLAFGCDCSDRPARGSGDGTPARDEPPSAEAEPEPGPADRTRDEGRHDDAPAGSSDDRRIVPAAHDDDGHAGTEPVKAQRLVYRVTLRVPGVLGDAPSTIRDPSAELHVDVSDDRLHARFAGAGWPVEAGSEVRLREDFPGVYVFDSEGGRPLPPGGLAEWFQGGPVRSSAGPSVRIRGPHPDEASGPGNLICALLAEWSGQRRRGLARRCGEGGAPPMFRIGPWMGERTADVPVDLPREALRADHETPPRPIAPSDSRAFAEPSLLARIEPAATPRAPDSDAAEEEGAPGEGLRVINDSPARAIVTIGGVAVGWVDAGATGHFVGPRPGEHTVAAMRPLGTLGWSARPVVVPGEIEID